MVRPCQSYCRYALVATPTWVARNVITESNSREEERSSMLGIKTRNFVPLVNVSLEELVPAAHFYRQLEQKLDVSFVRGLTGKSSARGGRPSIDPIVFFQLQLIM